MDWVGHIFLVVTLLWVASQTAAASELRSSSHLGFAVERSSNLGFSGATGSAVMLDVGKRFDQGVTLGMTTLGFGGAQDGERYYRMGAGPNIAVEIFRNWQVGSALFYYSESGLTGANEKSYRSQGGGVMVHWQRGVELVSGVQFAWGGFFTAQKGGVLVNTSTASSINRSGVRINEGWSQGLRVSLQTDL